MRIRPSLKSRLDDSSAANYELEVKVKQALAVMEEFMYSPEVLKAMLEHNHGSLYHMLKCILSGEEQNELAGTCSEKGDLADLWVKKVCSKSPYNPQRRGNRYSLSSS